VTPLAAAGSSRPSTRACGASGVGGRIPRLIVVSYLAHSPFTPRGLRTRSLLEGLRREWAVDLIAGPGESAVASESPQGRRSLGRRALSLAHSTVFLDKVEPWSWWRFRTWSPAADGALLIGYPFSPLVYAGRVLSSRGIPYVVDVGDPWVLTARTPALHGPSRVRGRAAETRLWADASAAIVTTRGQRDALQAKFPELPVLVRPNGLDVPSRIASTAISRSRAHSSAVLRLAHFGQITPARVSIAPFLEALASSGRWQRVELHQFGPDWTGELAAQSAALIVYHGQVPWPELTAAAVEYDLALVVGNLDGTQLPSKAVAYLELPIPRLAVVRDLTSDSLAGYVADKPGWLTLSLGTADLATRVHDHVSRHWAWKDLRPPETESWHQVTEAVLRFLWPALSVAHGSMMADELTRH
jgi:hypothetical protein